MCTFVCNTSDEAKHAQNWRLTKVIQVLQSREVPSGTGPMVKQEHLKAIAFASIGLWLVLGTALLERLLHL